MHHLVRLLSAVRFGSFFSLFPGYGVASEICNFQRLRNVIMDITMDIAMEYSERGSVGKIKQCI
ncbi:MAG: hypothetical protein A3K90_06560 [Pelodictyon luteolum]|uniref:Uncharacterized protein n=2 Tax=Pelodictyon luteolum TaxID=1100 RepID=A0A165LRN7_PELLU|nr:MAG: hypothetical protein A3K90_06560 [Pelodictyon luteolum]